MASKALRFCVQLLVTVAVVVAGGLALFLSATYLSGCAPSPSLKREMLVDQLLIPAPGYKGLVYEHCKEYRADGTCKILEYLEYRLADAATRERLLTAGVACVVGRKIYEPCADENALCHRKLGKRPFLGIIGKRPETIEKLSFETEYQKLLDAPTVCGSDLERLWELSR
jgi:hypothetical protein